MTEGVLSVYEIHF